MTNTTELVNLPNGAVVLSRKPLADRPGMMRAEIVLCHIPHNKVTPFVTWQRNIDENSTYWGHYYGNENEARSDFRSRGAN